MSILIDFLIKSIWIKSGNGKPKNEGYLGRELRVVQTTIIIKLFFRT